MPAQSGFILLNKKEGVSSHSALTPLKKLLPKNTKIGHTGTLDPNATGLLPVAVGRASKFIQYLGEHPKKYRAGILFGRKTDSGDIWGKTLAELEIRKNSECEHAEKLTLFRDRMKGFLGKISQVPPMYSAIKKDGKPLYKYAREGIELERSAREVEIYQIDILEFDYPNVTIEVECSKGTYIRTLIEDLAESMGEMACMSSLLRLKSDGFDLKDAQKIEEFQTYKDLRDKLIPIEKVFERLPKVQVDAAHAKHIKNGVPVDLSRFPSRESGVFGYYSVCDERELMFALAERNEEQFRTVAVI